MKDNIIAYCVFHKREMDISTLQNKSCLYKNNSGTTCRHLKREVSHKYWKDRQMRYGDRAIQSRYVKYLK